jgi:periplasmic protein TonB
MSYAQRKQMSGNRTAAIVVVALLHAILGYALITGLAYNVIKKAAEDLKTFDVQEEPPPPPDEPPPPPEDMPDVPPPPVQPPPMVRLDRPPPPIQIQESPVIPPAPPVVPPRVYPPAPPAPPAPPPVARSEPKSAVGNLQGLITGDDYPSSALANEEEETVTVRLSIGADGRVSGCSVSGSSGSRTLDSTTCRVLQRRAKFTPARDANGQPTTGSFTQRITWRLE